MVKQIIFISAIYSLTLNGMSDDKVPVTPDTVAQTIEQTILQPAAKSQSDQVIKRIKQVLKDDSLSAPQSLLVKDSLIKILSAKILDTHYANIPDDAGLSQGLIRKIFYDGTVSLEKMENFPPFDRCSLTVLSEKPRSPWHELSFEEFLRRYWSVRYPQAQPRLTDSTISQQQ